MTKQTGTIITIVLAVIFGCCGLITCSSGVIALAGLGTWDTTDFSGVTRTGQIPPVYGLPIICLGIVFVAIPVVSYFLWVRGKNGDTVTR